MSRDLFPSEKQLRTAKVLIIDDEETYVRAVEWVLQQAKFRNLRGVTKSTLAREEFVRFQPDLVLLDLHMPELDGFAVLEQLRQLVPAGEFLPVLAMTGYSAADTRSRALAAGATDFLGKPFDNTEVMLRVKNLLQTRFLYKHAREIQARLEALPGANEPPALPGGKA
jgi:putative two-component system response regulator